MDRRIRHEMDEGFTLIEMLIVIVVMGIMATVVVVSVTGITDRGERASCEGDHRTLAVAAESYFAQVGGNSIPATGVGVDRYERTLMLQGFVTEPSELYDIDDTGAVVVSPSSRCTSL